jgi:ATP-binding cassette subfamily B protein
VEVPAQFLDYGFWSVFLYAEIIAIVIVLALGVRAVFAGTLTVGVLVLFIEYIRQMFQPIMQLSEQLNFFQRSLVSVERVMGILETKPAVTDGGADPAELHFEHSVAFEGVWFAYEGENWVVRDLSFAIPKGQKIALVGESGGGKSTIVNLLLRFYDPQRGRITVDGRDIRDFPLHAWRELIGLVLQDVFLFPGTVKDNIRVFDQSISEEQVARVAEVTCADRFIGALPGGYDGDLAERGANLSVGERQLLSFARALAYDPPLLVLDEATSSVDPHTERTVQEALDHLLEGRTAVIVAHRLSTILNADRIIMVHDGEIAERGTHRELLAADGLYAKLFRLQFPDAAVGAGA